MEVNMALQFILGNSGSGKSYYLQELVIKQAMENPNKEYLYIVPEQFTLQKQKDIVNSHPGKVIMNIDVCSFNRLAHRVFEELGIKEQLILEDTGKSMVIRKIIEENKKDLQLFHSSVHRDGFVEEIKSVISEFCQYNVSVDQLKDFVDGNNMGINCGAKFGELIVLYKLFREFLKGRYITSEELLDILAANVHNSRILKDSVIVLDEYTGFTPVQNNLILQLLGVCETMMVAVTVDSKELSNIDNIDKQTLFRMSAKTITSLKAIAKEAKVDVLKDVVIDGAGRFINSPKLKHLESNIFRYPYKTYESTKSENVSEIQMDMYSEAAMHQKSQLDMDEADNAISIHYAKDIATECEFIVNKIKEYVGYKGYRYRDFAILCGDMKEYGRVLSRIFERENISYFYDIKKHILNNPFVEMISALFDICNSDYSYEAVFRYLRSGMSDIDTLECDILDNYIFTTGIKGYRLWSKQFTRKCIRPYAMDLAVVNEIRGKVLLEVEDIVKELKGLKDAGSITRALYNYIVSRYCEEKLCQLSDRFETEGKMLLAKEYIQVYPAVMNLFDKIMELIPDAPMKVLEYSKIFETGMGEVKVGLIPLSIDQVSIGDIERSRIANVKVVFLAGVNEGIIPKNISSGGLISEVEREAMILSGIEMAKAKSEAVFNQQYYIYLALTKASESLYLTYSGMGNDGKARRQSYLINRVKALFLDMETNIIEADKLTWKKDALDYLIEGLKEENITKDEKWNEVLRWNLSHDKSRERLNRILDIIYRKKDKDISPDIARKIFESNVYSVSKIQNYCSCQYSYFLKYGLNIRPKTTSGLSVIDMGVIYHDALNRYCTALVEDKISFAEVSEEYSKKLVEVCVKDAVDQIMDEEMLEDEVNKFIVERIKKLILATVENLSRNVKKSGFVPRDFEVGFKVKHKDLVIEGKIDRVDFLSDEDAQYYAITDYKSSMKTFDPTLFGNGIDIQLIVYSVAARQIYDEEVLPAGVYYSRLDRPVVKYDSKFFEKNELGEMTIAKEELNEAIDKETKKYGLDCISEDVEDDGKVSERKKLGRDQLKALEKYALNITSSTHDNIMNGSIKINPYRYGSEQNACAWCEYSSICGFDSNSDRYRKLKKYTIDELTKDELTNDKEEL